MTHRRDSTKTACEPETCPGSRAVSAGSGQWWQVMCLASGHRGQGLARHAGQPADVTGAAAGLAGGRPCTLPACRKPGWSSLLSLSRSARSARLPAPTGSPGPGSTRCWPATSPKARRRSSRGPGGRRPHRTHRRCHGRPDHPSCARNWPGRAWMPGRTPSPGTWSAIIRCGCRRRRSPGTWPGTGWWSPSRASGRRSSYIRFAAEQPNECWQSDFTHYPLAGGTGTEILTWLDDHSRLAVRVTAWNRVTGPIVLDRASAPPPPPMAPPAPALTDNGMVFTTGSPAARAAATPSSTNCGASASPRRTAPPLQAKGDPRLRARPTWYKPGTSGARHPADTAVAEQARTTIAKKPGGRHYPQVRALRQSPSW